jgi:hypothetical protein
MMLAKIDMLRQLVTHGLLQPRYALWLAGTVGCVRFTFDRVGGKAEVFSSGD